MSQYKPIEKTDSIDFNSIINNPNGILMHEYLIKENRHTSQNRQVILHSSNEFTILCKFEKSCYYSFADSNSINAINKIFGYSFGSNHHNNSFRIGWRCKNNLIEVLAYWFIKRKHFDSHLFYIEPGELFFLNAAINSMETRINYSIEGRQLEYQDIVFNPDSVKLKNWGYVNYPYFGGKRKAPNDMVINLKAWINK